LRRGADSEADLNGDCDRNRHCNRYGDGNRHRYGDSDTVDGSERG